jgi:ribosomal protein L18E
MLKRTAACITLAAFLVASNGCMMWGTRRLETVPDYPKLNSKIWSLVKKSGETVVFAASAPGRVLGDAIVGKAISRENIEIRKPVPVVAKRDDGSISKITTSDGRVIPVEKVLSEDADTFMIYGGATTLVEVTIPLSEVASVKFKKFNFLKAGLLFAGACAVSSVFIVHYLRNRD